jgi:hypothetical protein
MRYLTPTLISLFLLASCGAIGNSAGSFGGSAGQQRAAEPAAERETIWDLFRADDSNSNIRVSKYLWAASLETLNFLPVEAADPFTGVIVMGWGAAPGSNQQYKATVFIKDPALEARSLTLSMVRRTGGGSAPASAEVVRQIEDAILTRARQLRVADSKL